MCGDLTKARRKRVVTRKVGATVRPTVAGRRLKTLLRLGVRVKRRRQILMATYCLSRLEVEGLARKLLRSHSYARVVIRESCKVRDMTFCKSQLQYKRRLHQETFVGLRFRDREVHATGCVTDRESERSHRRRGSERVRSLPRERPGRRNCQECGTRPFAASLPTTLSSATSLCPHLS